MQYRRGMCEQSLSQQWAKYEYLYRETVKGSSETIRQEYWESIDYRSQVRNPSKHYAVSRSLERVLPRT